MVDGTLEPWGLGPEGAEARRRHLGPRAAWLASLGLLALAACDGQTAGVLLEYEGTSFLQMREDGDARLEIWSEGRCVQTLNSPWPFSVSRVDLTGDGRPEFLVEQASGSEAPWSLFHVYAVDPFRKLSTFEAEDESAFHVEGSRIRVKDTTFVREYAWTGPAPTPEVDLVWAGARFRLEFPPGRFDPCLESLASQEALLREMIRLAYLGEIRIASETLSRMNRPEVEVEFRVLMSRSPYGRQILEEL